MPDLISWRRAHLMIAACLVLGVPALPARDFKDELGRSVRAPENPQRIVCLAPSLTETVYALGLGSTVVGVTDFTDYPAEAKSKPTVGALDNVSVEKIVSLHPDLVLSLGVINREDTVNELQNLGIPVFCVNPQTLQGILDSIQHVGDALNHSSDATHLLKQLQARQAAVALRVAKLVRPSSLVVIWYDPVITAGSHSFITDVIEAAGGHSVTADLPQAWPEISMEEVVRRRPDFLVLVRGMRGGIEEQDLKVRAGWDQLQAVRENRILYLDERLLRPSPVAFDAMEQLAKGLHPKAFESGGR